MRKIVKFVSELVEKNLIGKADIENTEDIDFVKGDIKFWIQQDYETKRITLQVNEKKGINYGKEIEYEYYYSEERTIERIIEILNDESLYKKAIAFYKKARERREQDYKLNPLDRYKDSIEHSTKKIKILESKVEYQILCEGLDNKVLVKWFRGDKIIYKDGFEYSVHTLSINNELIWGHYFREEENAIEYYKPFYLTSLESKILQWVGMYEMELKRFKKYLKENNIIDLDLHYDMDNDGIEWLKNIYKNNM